MKIGKALTAILLLASLVTAGCVYRIDIQQGNEITPEMIEQLELGMTKREVTRILGLPLITDPFHRDRWDYYYSHKEGRTGNVTSQQATLLFTDDLLSDVSSSFSDQP